MLTGVSGRPGAAPGRHWRRPRRARSGRERPARYARWARPAAWALAITMAGAALFALYFSESLATAISSDGAANVLQGQALDQGNLLLSGWWTSDVSFYTTELPEYALITAIRGVSPGVVHICGALTYTLTVLLAVLLAWGRAAEPAPGRARGVAPGGYAAGIAAAIVLAPSIRGGIAVFLENPDHAGTAVPVLLLLLLLDRARLRRWYVPVAACGLLAVTQLGDPLSLAAATVPLALVCAVRLIARAVRRPPRAEFRDDARLLAAAAVSAGLASLAGHVIRSLGGFDVRPLRDGLFVPLGQVPANARTLGHSLVLLFGANQPGVPQWPLLLTRREPLTLVADLHLIGLVLAAAGLAAGIAACVRGRADRLTQVLVAALGVLLAAGLFTQIMRSLANAHEMAIVVPLSAVLAGRTLPPLAVARARRLAAARRARVSPGRAAPAGGPPAGRPFGGAESGREPSGRLRPGRLAAVALAGWLVVSLAELGYAAVWPPAPRAMTTIATWLVAHHEQEGLAGYWQANVTTVASGGRVLVAPVTRTGTGVYRWESSDAWYRPGPNRATFVITVPGPGAPIGSLTIAVARARFGPYAARYRVGGDVILTYRHNLLARLAGRAFPGAS